jgi:hypothetical protein
MENKHKLQKIKSACIILGMLIYFTRLFREDLKGHETILYLLGFIPNFGMSFAFPFMFFSKKHILSNLYKINFYIGCIIVFMIMI